MFPNKIGIADFGAVKIECLEIVDDDGVFVKHLFKYEGQDKSYVEICTLLRQDFPAIARLLISLGQGKFLASVLEWDPSKDSTRRTFYQFLASELNRTNGW